MDKATFAAGCFWGIEEHFRHIPGVMKTTVGYTGGHFVNPAYRDVCAGQTGHAEAIEIEYDPEVVSFDNLLVIFWKVHNPTTLNRQGPDIGSQYRSAIFYHNDEQKQSAIKSKIQLNNSHQYSSPIVTEITPTSKFFPAEEYHQKYIAKQQRN